MSTPRTPVNERALLRSALLGRSCVAVVSALLFSTAEAGPESYPVRAVRVVIPSAMGGPSDLVARALALKLSEWLGQPIISENRAGANGRLGAEVVARAAPDGYTLLIASNPLAINAARHAKPAADPLAEFAPVSLVAQVASVLVVHPSLPVKSVADVVAFGRSRPHELMYASGGGGSPPHLAALLFSVMTGVKMVHVPYRGGRLALHEVIGGHVPLTFGNTIIALPQVRSGRLRALAVTTAKRSNAAPELPTMDEAGVKGYEATGWYALLAPAGTSGTVVRHLNTGVIAVIDAPEVKTRVAPLGADMTPGTPAELGQYIRAEVEKWGKVLRTVGAAENLEER